MRNMNILNQYLAPVMGKLLKLSGASLVVIVTTPVVLGIAIWTFMRSTRPTIHESKSPKGVSDNDAKKVALWNFYTFPYEIYFPEIPV